MLYTTFLELKHTQYSKVQTDVKRLTLDIDTFRLRKMFTL